MAYDIERRGVESLNDGEMLERGFEDGKAETPVRGERCRHNWRAADDSIERDIFRTEGIQRVRLCL